MRDQVEALRRLPGLEVELFTFASRGPSAYPRAAWQARRHYGSRRFDVIHAHFGLNLWPALALRGAHAVTLHGTDLVHPRSRSITLAALPFADLVAPVSRALSELIPAGRVRGRLEVLPCGVDMGRFRAIDRREARRALSLDEEGTFLLFAANPDRPEKRYDRALELAGDARLLSLGQIEPNQVPLWINAVNAVLVTSTRESFGLAVLEALACDVPVLSTPVGIAPEVLPMVAGTYCGEFDLERWREALAPLLEDPDPRVDGRAAAEAYSATRAAERVRDAWETLA